MHKGLKEVLFRVFYAEFAQFDSSKGLLIIGFCMFEMVVGSDAIECRSSGRFIRWIGIDFFLLKKFNQS